MIFVTSTSALCFRGPAVLKLFVNEGRILAHERIIFAPRRFLEMNEIVGQPLQPAGRRFDDFR